MNRRAGFTLMEVLVVIVLVGVLAALALPRFLKTTDERYRREIKTTLEEIRAANDVYRLEHGQFTPNLNNLPMQNPNARSGGNVVYQMSATTDPSLIVWAWYKRKSPNPQMTLIYLPGRTPEKEIKESGW